MMNFFIFAAANYYKRAIQTQMREEMEQTKNPNAAQSKQYGVTMESIVAEVGERGALLMEKFYQYKKEGTAVLVSGNALVAASLIYECRVEALKDSPAAQDEDSPYAALLEKCRQDLKACQQRLQEDRVRADTSAEASLQPALKKPTTPDSPTTTPTFYQRAIAAVSQSPYRPLRYLLLVALCVALIAMYIQLDHPNSV